MAGGIPAIGLPGTSILLFIIGIAVSQTHAKNMTLHPNLSHSWDLCLIASFPRPSARPTDLSAERGTRDRIGSRNRKHLNLGREVYI
jgi:hypothetical protein